MARRSVLNRALLGKTKRARPAPCLIIQVLKNSFRQPDSWLEGFAKFGGAQL